jgi:hypothetical protein
MPIRIAFTVTAPKELTLTAGRVEIVTPPAEDQAVDPPFLKIGRAQGDELHLCGPLIDDPAKLADSLAVRWYFPDEEMPEEGRLVDLSEARSIIAVTPRKKAEFGWHWRYRYDSRANSQATYFFSDGFQPPFKPGELTLYLEHLANYNYTGYILSHLEYSYRHPSYTESEWGLPTMESEGFLED